MVDTGYFNEQLKKIIEKNLYRGLNTIEKETSNTICIGGKEYINFGSNDYFGISKNQEVIQKGQEVLEEFGSNICSAQTLCGYSIYHSSLTELLKNIFDTDNILLFSSGYLANLSIFQIFPKNDTEILMDVYSHRSLIDSARLSGIKLFFYRHLDYEMLEGLLSKSKAKYKVIATDSVFSMEGTIVDLKNLIKIKEEYDAILVIDDAHGFIVLDKSVFDYFSVRIREIDNVIYIATFSKAAGCLGGFLTGEKTLIELIKNMASTFLFDTALPPHICAMVKKALEILIKQKVYLERLKNNIDLLNRNLKMNQKIPIFIKRYSNLAILSDVFNLLLKNNIYVPAIKPPTVPEKYVRLRISVCASHTKEQLMKLSEHIVHT